MREIKFRAWHIENKFMFSVRCIDFGSLGKETGDVAKFDVYWWKDEPATESDPWTEDVFFSGDEIELMQFTGLHDKNGQEIYEGDIVKNERGEVGKIVFVNGAFVSQYLPPHDWDSMEPCDGLLDRQEVIGNIYDNLKGK